MQKLKMSFFHLLESLFTCFLKDKTLHNHWDYAGFTVPYYNIPSNNRELQPPTMVQCRSRDYNIPSNNRELQLRRFRLWFLSIITYQVITGNYSSTPSQNCCPLIITYQVITGNYSSAALFLSCFVIITYQVITGNYSCKCFCRQRRSIITYQVITGNYSLTFCRFPFYLL